MNVKIVSIADRYVMESSLDVAAAVFAYLWALSNGL